ncbi:MAG: hypothetical protein ABL966_12635 [Acidimicrobiales bacterium]
MARQLTLLDTPPSWRIDEATREVGRRGIAEARATLQAALAARAAGDAEPAGREHPSHGRSAA